jgi:hypothetical protein
VFGGDDGRQSPQRTLPQRGCIGGFLNTAGEDPQPDRVRVDASRQRTDDRCHVGRHPDGAIRLGFSRTRRRRLGRVNDVAGRRRIAGYAAEVRKPVQKPAAALPRHRYGERSALVHRLVVQRHWLPLDCMRERAGIAGLS